MQIQNKFLNLESLRGIAALSVALFHFSVKSHFHNSFVANAWLMVDFFFVLSGFVIALNYQFRIKSFSNFLHFQYKRFLRLYPLHILMLVVFLGIEIAKYIVELQFNMIADNRAFSTNDFISFIANILIIQNWTISDLTWNFPSWSISAEFYTYAIFGIIAIFMKNSRLLISGISLLLVIIAGYILFTEGMSTSNITGPTRCIYSFFIGVFTYNIFHYFELQERIKSSTSSLIFLGISVFFVALEFSSTNHLTIIIPLIFSVTILLVVSTKETAKINIVLSNPYLVYLGTISYGIYMIHSAVWWTFRQVLRFAFQLPAEIDAEGKNTIDFGNVYLADMAVVLGVIIIVLSAHLSYKFIETRYNYKRQKVTIE